MNTSRMPVLQAMGRMIRVAHTAYTASVQRGVQCNVTNCSVLHIYSIIAMQTQMFL